MHSTLEHKDGSYAPIKLMSEECNPNWLGVRFTIAMSAVVIRAQDAGHGGKG